VGCGCNSPKWLAVDPLTGDCLLFDEQGGCRRFASSGRALRAARAAGHENPGVLRA
jgi:hypothetical protein